MGKCFIYLKHCYNLLLPICVTAYKVVALARLASFFLLFSQKKETKEKATPLPLYPSVLAPHLRGDCGTRIFNPQTVLVT
jgi:hypothetical protein